MPSRCISSLVVGRNAPGLTDLWGIVSMLLKLFDYMMNVINAFKKNGRSPSMIILDLLDSKSF
jgi:hypothetical protein